MSSRGSESGTGREGLVAFLVQLTDGATCDLEEIYDHICRHDEPGSADRVLNQSEIAFKSLAESPERGSHVK